MIDCESLSSALQGSSMLKKGSIYFHLDDTVTAVLSTWDQLILTDSGLDTVPLFHVREYDEVIK